MAEPIKTKNRLLQVRQAFAGLAVLLFRRKQLVLTLLALLPFGQVTALGAELSDDDMPDAERAVAFETLSIHRPKVVWFGKGKSRIGNYAEVTHKFRSGSSNYSTSEYKFSIDVNTSEGAKVNLNGLIHTDYNRIEDDQGLLGSIVGSVIEERTGISDVELGYDAYTSTFTSTIVTGKSPGETWQFLVEKRWKVGDYFQQTSGTLSNGQRTLQITERFEGTPLEFFEDIYEGGELLSGRHNNDYVFRTDLSPDLKLLLLTAMEIVSITERGECR